VVTVAADTSPPALMVVAASIERGVMSGSETVTVRAS
jgi:hypothetical protein